MKHSLVALALLLVPAAEVGRAADDEKVKKELKLLAGKWELVSEKAEGKSFPLGDKKTYLIIKEDGKYTNKLGDKEQNVGTLKIDPTKKPKTLDFTDPRNPKRVGHVIYELNGDELRYCVGPPGSERPADFSSKEGSRHVISTWKRVK